MKLPDTLRQQLAAMVEDYLRQLPNRMSEVYAAFEQIGKNPEDLEAYKTFRLLVHKLAGSGATFGYDTVSEAARELETLLSQIIDSGLLAMSMTEGELPVAVDRLREACTQATETEHMEDLEPIPDEVDEVKTPVSHREVILFSREENTDVDDIQDQLGFFWFYSHPRVRSATVQEAHQQESKQTGYYPHERIRSRQIDCAKPFGAQRALSRSRQVYLHF